MDENIENTRRNEKDETRDQQPVEYDRGFHGKSVRMFLFADVKTCFSPFCQLVLSPTRPVTAFLQNYHHFGHHKSNLSLLSTPRNLYRQLNVHHQLCTTSTTEPPSPMRLPRHHLSHCTASVPVNRFCRTEPSAPQTSAAPQASPAPQAPQAPALGRAICRRSRAVTAAGAPLLPTYCSRVARRQVGCVT